MKSQRALYPLALGSFGIGMTEFVAIGLLPLIAQEFQISTPQAGWVVTAYALGVMLSAPLLTLISLRIPRRRLLILLMFLYAIGNLLTALSPTFLFLLSGRVLTSFTHGVFFGVGSIVAGQLVEKGKQAQAIAFMFSGLTLANLIGVPLGTWIGNAFGWRFVFFFMAVLGFLTAISLRLLPELPAAGSINIGTEIRTLARIDVFLALAVTLLGFGGVFAAITYLATLITDYTGFSKEWITPTLMLLGVGMVIGSWLGGKYADRRLIPTIIWSITALVVTLLAFGLTASSKPLTLLTVFLIGVFGFATVPPLQTFVLHQAADAPALSAAVNVGVFNLSNALAAWLGGIAINLGLGLNSVGYVGAILSGSGLLLALLIQRRNSDPRVS